VVADIPWKQAWEAAAFGPRGFYVNSLPYDHFTTSVEQAVVATELLPYLQVALTNGPVTFIDVGAGTGLLAEQLRALVNPTEAQGTSFLCLDLRPRPQGLAPEIEWIQGDIRETIKQVPAGNAVLVAHEFLDDLPCTVVEVDEAGRAHIVVIDAEHGEQKLGPILAQHSPERAWLDRWWPTTRPFMRCEVGITRDACWRQLTSVVNSGFAIAIDYAHMRDDRVRGVWDGGTLAGYAHGTLKTPHLTGATNITAHVALDALASSSHGNPQTQIFRSGPSSDFWWLIAAYGNHSPAPAKMKA
jgi:SAM-dependent MidA family methyltransferase